MEIATPQPTGAYPAQFALGLSIFRTLAAGPQWTRHSLLICHSQTSCGSLCRHWLKPTQGGCYSLIPLSPLLPGAMIWCDFRGPIVRYRTRLKSWIVRWRCGRNCVLCGEGAAEITYNAAKVRSKSVNYAVIMRFLPCFINWSWFFHHIGRITSLTRVSTWAI